MTDDLVKRLRDMCGDDGILAIRDIYDHDVAEAADRIEKLEAENKKFKCGLWSVINLCKWGVDRIPSFCSEPEGFCQCRKAFDALDYDLSNMYPMD